MHGNRYMKIFADKGLTKFSFAPEILKSFRETEKNNKNLEFDLGQNPLEIVHGPLKKKSIFKKFKLCQSG